MSARRSLPIGIIVMILMMALAALGVGYAWWTEQLTATGTIQTGSIDVQIKSISTQEDDPLDVASCTPTLSIDNKILTVTIDNAYPEYACTVRFNFVNLGSVPAKITSMSLPIEEGEFGIIPSGALISKPRLDPASPQGADFYIRIQPGAQQKASYQFNFGIGVTQSNAP